MAQMMGYESSAETQSEVILPKEIPAPSDDQITGNPIQPPSKLIAYSKKELKELVIGSSIVIDFSGSEGLAVEDISSIESKFARKKYRDYEIDLSVLEAFDSDLAILDFDDKMPLGLKVGICAWLFRNDLIESVEIDSIYQPI